MGFMRRLHRAIRQLRIDYRWGSRLDMVAVKHWETKDLWLCNEMVKGQGLGGL
jgi:hypothetical protein